LSGKTPTSKSVSQVDCWPSRTLIRFQIIVATSLLLQCAVFLFSMVVQTSKDLMFQNCQHRRKQKKKQKNITGID